MMELLPYALAVVGAIGVGGVVILLLGWPAVASFLIGTKLGRWLAGAAALLLAILWYGIAQRRKGVAQEVARQKADQYKAAQKRVRKDEEIRNLPAADARRRLNEWVRD